MKAKVTLRSEDISKRQWTKKHSFDVVGADEQDVVLDDKTNRRCRIDALVGQREVPFSWRGNTYLCEVISFDGLET